MNCQVCRENLAKYKCSNCCKPYCSVNCWKNHKNTDVCEAVVPKDKIQVNEESRKKYFTEDTVPEKKLRALGESEIMKKILKSEYLRQTLIAVEDSTQPEKAVVNAMKDSEFVEFVNECMRIVEDNNDN